LDQVRVGARDGETEMKREQKKLTCAAIRRSPPIPPTTTFNVVRLSSDLTISNGEWPRNFPFKFQRRRKLSFIVTAISSTHANSIKVGVKFCVLLTVFV
jgi:hypothetical protein